MLEQLAGVQSQQAGQGFRPGDAIGNQPGLHLVGPHCGLGGIAEDAVRDQLGAPVVELALQVPNRLGAVAVSKGSHAVSSLRVKNFFAVARMNSTPSRPITPPKNGAALIGMPIKGKPW